MRVIKSDVEFHVIVVFIIIGGYKDNTNLSIFPHLKRFLIPKKFSAPFS